MILRIGLCFLLCIELALQSGCGLLFDTADDPAEEDSLDVVNDRGAFDPAAAVDDIDDHETPAPSTSEEVARPARGERVATPEEAARERRRKQREVRSANLYGDREGEKTELARNPGAADPGAGKGLTLNLRDLVLEVLFLAALAFGVALVAAVVRRYSRVTAIVASIGAAIGLVLLLVRWGD